MDPKTDDIAAVGATEQVRPFSDVIDQVQSDAFQLEAATQALEQGFQRALTMPLQEAGSNAAVQEFSAASPGEISASKGDFVADTGASGDAADGGQSDPEAGFNASVDRIKDIYMELANWHLVWGIAHKTQQDTSQLLRGQ